MRRTRRHIRWATTLVMAAMALAGSASAVTKYKILHAFAGLPKDGAGAWGSLAFDAKGNLYGMTEGGGRSCCGVIFELTPHAGGRWTEFILQQLNCKTSPEGCMPESGFVLGASGSFYGMTLRGGGKGGGTVFELSPSSDGWKIAVMYDDEGGWASLILDQAGNLYAPLGANAISELVKDDGWAESALYSFCSKNNRQHRCLDGSEPFAGVTWGPEGSLYGTTVEGGSAGYGVVFQLTPQEDGTWSESLLHSFPATKDDGQKLYNSVTLDHVGNIYSATYQGGANDCGVIFELAPRASGKWKETILYDFPKLSLGCSANTLTFDAKGNLWGTAGGGGKYGDGVVFELTRRKNGKWTYHVVHQFNGADGALPASAVIFDKRGNLYGTTVLGGPGSSVGVVFEITP